MTATAPAHKTVPDSVGLSFPRLVRSEWIKFRSIRSTVWCFAIIAVVTIGMAALVGRAVNSGGTDVPTEQANASFVLINTVSVNLTALVVGVLGVLIISGEYGTGQIRSTFTADPGRVGVLLAKATVLAVATFVVSVVATAIGALLALALQASNGAHPEVGDPAVFMPILGASVLVTLVALLAFGIGLLVKSSAAGIAITLGLMLVVPTILQLAAALTNADWLLDLSQFLPLQAGAQLITYSSGAPAPEQTGIVLNGWGGFGVLAAEVVVVGALALVVTRRRDV